MKVHVSCYTIRTYKIPIVGVFHKILSQNTQYPLYKERVLGIGHRRKGLL